MSAKTSAQATAATAKTDTRLAWSWCWRRIPLSRPVPRHLAEGCCSRPSPRGPNVLGYRTSQTSSFNDHLGGGSALGNSTLSERAKARDGMPCCSALARRHCQFLLSGYHRKSMQPSIPRCCKGGVLTFSKSWPQSTLPLPPAWPSQTAIDPVTPDLSLTSVVRPQR